MADLKKPTQEELKKKLTPEQYSVMFEKGTEPRFEFQKNWQEGGEGMYVCAACGQPIFASSARFELDPSDWNYGWPSFDEPANRENIELKEDTAFGMRRTEVICKNCGAHLGHLFNDGPKEKGGEHYCVNSCALNFTPKK